MWSDNETDIDFLNFDAVASTVAEIIIQENGRPNLLLPQFHRGMLFFLILVPLVDGHYAAHGARDVVQEFFGHMNGNAERRKIGGEGPAQIVKRPVFN